MPASVPPERIRTVSRHRCVVEGDYVLYWMRSARRRRANFGLQHAAWEAERLRKPLLVFEALQADYPWASPRMHGFVVEGMRDNARALDVPGVAYFPYVEPTSGHSKGLLRALADRACLVVTDDQPGFVFPAQLEAAANRIDRRLDAVDGVGLLPVQHAERTFTRAHDFRRHLQKNLAPSLDRFPDDDPLLGFGGATLELDPDISSRWPQADVSCPERVVNGVPLAGSVEPVGLEGGAEAGRRRLEAFMTSRLERYAERNHPDVDAASGLSPYLHFGHIGGHEVARRVLQNEDWHPGRMADKRDGSRGFWGLSDAAEAFMDELVTWRELAHLDALHRPDGHRRYEGLPDWARTTLELHAEDPRPHHYDLETLARAETNDEIWNAAQTQLLREGVIHNYLRMLWGKRILEWTEHPAQAFEVLVELNNRYALDGRDPNSYAGIAWVLGRFDRAWGPEREIYGKVRYMSSANTKRKLRLKGYLARFGPST